MANRQDSPRQVPAASDTSGGDCGLPWEGPPLPLPQAVAAAHHKAARNAIADRRAVSVLTVDQFHPIGAQ